MLLARIRKLIKIAREDGLKEAVLSVINFISYNILSGPIIAYLKLRHGDNLMLRDIQGNRMYLDLSDPGISKLLILTGIHGKLATRMLKEEVKEGMTVVDIGSNLGYSTLIEAAAVGQKGIVYAIEPIRKNYEILCKNIDINGYNNIKAYCVAVSSKSGASEINSMAASNWGSMLDTNSKIISNHIKQRHYRLTQKTETVDTVSLDEFLDKERVNQVNLIRMDVEGYEIEAIKGMTNTLKNTWSPFKLYIEIHNLHFDNPESTIGVLLEQILTFGFKPKYMVLVDNIVRNISSDNLIKVACSYKLDCPQILLEK